MNVSNIFSELDSLVFSTGNIAIAVSGGADSLALTLIADIWAKNNNREIFAITVDHSLRPESQQEAQYVHGFLAERNIDHVTLVWEGEKPKSNIQSLARNARYELMTNWCKANDISYLLTGHHADDQAETVLMRLMRGSGINGLSAISKRSLYNGINIVRPLLAMYRAEIEKYLLSQNIKWVNDPSNKDKKYTRTKVRNFLSNENNLIDDTTVFKKRLNDIATHMQRAKSLLEDLTEESYNKYCILHELGYIKFARDDFQNIHEEIGLRLLSKILCTVNQNVREIRFAKLQNLYNSLVNDDDFKASTLAGCYIKYKKGDVIVMRELDK